MRPSQADGLVVIEEEKMVKAFEYSRSEKIKVGFNAVNEIGKIINEIGARKVLLASGRHVGETDFFSEIAKLIEEEGIEVVVYKEIENDPTVEAVDKGAEVLRQYGAEAVVAVGGGSVMDTAKGMCMLQTNCGSIEGYLFGGDKEVDEKGMPLIAVPTTAGTGSEVTHFTVINNTKKQVKLSVAHPYITPDYAIIDPMLTVGTSPYITATTGMDALTHAIESYVSLNATPVSKAFSLEAITLIGQNLLVANGDGNNLEARYNMAVASTIAGMAFDIAGVGAVHGIAQAIGGVVHVSHGMANALMLPHVMLRNLCGDFLGFSQIAQALGENVQGLSLQEGALKSVSAVETLLNGLSLPKRLSDSEIGVTKELFPQIIKETMDYRQLSINPCMLSSKDIEKILNQAF